jgi:hypothetical protein
MRGFVIAGLGQGVWPVVIFPPLAVIINCRLIQTLTIGRAIFMVDRPMGFRGGWKHVDDT